MLSIDFTTRHLYGLTLATCISREAPGVLSRYLWIHPLSSFLPKTHFQHTEADFAGLLRNIVFSYLGLFVAFGSSYPWFSPYAISTVYRWSIRDACSCSMDCWWRASRDDEILRLFFCVSTTTNDLCFSSRASPPHLSIPQARTYLWSILEFDSILPKPRKVQLSSLLSPTLASLLLLLVFLFSLPTFRHSST